MTRISSLFVASTLAILPISAFAQQTTDPVKTTAPASLTTAAPVKTAPVTAPVTGPVTNKAPATTQTNVTQPAKPDAKTPAVDTKTQVHGMNNVKTHHAKTSVPIKAAEPAKS